MPKRTVIVSGANGFLGRALCVSFMEAGWSVVAGVRREDDAGEMQRYLTSTKFRGLDRYVIGDLSTPDPWRAIGQVDTIVNAAAQVSVRQSIDAPTATFENNTAILLQALEFARASTGRRRIVCISSSEVYGTAQDIPMSEEHPVVPQSPYAASKVACEDLCESYRRCFSMDIVTVRPFNLYGEGQSAKAFIPSILHQIANGDQQISVGDLQPRRDFNHVTDTARAIVRLASLRMPSHKIYNIASGTDRAMREVLDLIMCADIDGPPPSIVEDKSRFRPRHGEVRRLCGDASRLANEIGEWRTVEFESRISTMAASAWASRAGLKG